MVINVTSESALPQNAGLCPFLAGHGWCGQIIINPFCRCYLSCNFFFLHRDVSLHKKITFWVWAVCCVSVCVWMNGCLDVLVSAVCVLCVCVLLSVMYVVVCGVLTGPSRCPLSCMYALSPHLTGDLDGHWWDHASWHSSEASPMSLVRHVEPCLDPPLPSLLPLDPPSLSLLLCLSPPPIPPSPRVFCHFMFP